LVQAVRVAQTQVQAVAQAQVQIQVLVLLLPQQVAAVAQAHLLAQHRADRAAAVDQAEVVQAERQDKVMRAVVAQTKPEVAAGEQAQLAAQEAAQQAEQAEQVRHRQSQVLVLLMPEAEVVEQTPADRAGEVDRAEAEQDQQDQVLRARLTLEAAAEVAAITLTAAQVVRALLFFQFLLQNTRALQPDRQQLPLVVAILY
jgi:hypothetical protein